MKRSRTLTKAVTLYLGCCVSLALLWRSSFLLVMVYLFVSGLMLYKWHRRNDLFFYMIGFALGPLGELGGVYTGAWTYSDAPFLIPIWLPPLWGIVTLSLKKFCDQLAKQSVSG